jgi:uncharacterized protein YbbC (DUF1343 family)
MFSTQAAEKESDLLFRIHIQDNEKNEEVAISVPLSILQLVYPLLPDNVRQECQKKGIHVDKVLEEMNKTKGEDILQINDRHKKIRAWIATADRNDEEAMQNIRVKVTSPEQDAPKVNLCIPKGFVALMLESGNAFAMNPNQLDMFMTHETKK